MDHEETSRVASVYLHKSQNEMMSDQQIKLGHVLLGLTANTG